MAHEKGGLQCGVDLDIYEKRLLEEGYNPVLSSAIVGTLRCLSFSVWRAESSHD